MNIKITVFLNYGIPQCFQPLQWSRTLCRNFDCSQNPCLFGRDSWGPNPKSGDGFLGTHYLGSLGEWKYILYLSTKSLENTSSGRKYRTPFNYLLSAAEPLDTTGRTLRFRGTPVEKQWHTPWKRIYQVCLNNLLFTETTILSASLISRLLSQITGLFRQCLYSSVFFLIF